MNLKKLNAKKAELLSKMETIVNGTEDALTAEQQKEFDTLKAEFDTTVKNVETAENLEKSKQDAKRGAPVLERIVPETNIETEITQKITLPAQVRKSLSLRAFRGVDGNERAYGFGRFIQACNGDYEAQRWCWDHGINVSKFATTHSSGTDASSGYLVPTAYSSDIAALIYEYGVARKEANVIQLGTDTFNRPKRTAGLTAYCVSESAAGTESNKTFGQIQLTVKDWVVLARMTRQLSQDSLISVADDLANEIAMQFAYAEDNTLFNGDGEAVYGSVKGVIHRLTETYGTSSTGKGLVNSATNDTVAITDLRTVISKIPSFCLRNSKWYVNPAIFHNYFASLADAKMVNVTDVTNGISGDRFMGFPVVYVDVMPSSIGNTSDSSVIALFGDLRRCADFGDRQQTMIDFSDSAVINGESVFERGQIAVRGTERFAINVHSYGQDSEPTPICGLYV